jgi:hypothetical protein
MVIIGLLPSPHDVVLVNPHDAAAVFEERGLLLSRDAKSG